MKRITLRILSGLLLLLFAAGMIFVYGWKGGVIGLAAITIAAAILMAVLPGDVFRFLVRRIAFGLVTLWFIFSVVFMLYFAVPHDVARQIAGRAVTPQLLDSIRHAYGLDKPLLVQYGDFLNSTLHGNLRVSFVGGRVPVNDIIARAVPKDISLAVGAGVIWMTMGIGIGVLAARRPRGWVDRSATVFVLAGISMPTFILGLLLLYFLYYLLTLNGIAIFPKPGSYTPIGTNPLEWARDLILPWITLALVTAATYSRLTRSSLLETLGEDYIRTARAKGLSERRVVYRHGLRSALTPIVTQFGIDFATTLGGVIVTETVFSIPGLGLTAVQAISNQNLPVILGVIIVAGTFIVAMNIIVDATYAFLDPRVRVS